jgi:hypothetical protein
MALGGGLAGVWGIPPLLQGGGELTADTPLSMTMLKGGANKPVTLIVGFAELNAPFKGGTLVPTPDVLIAGLAFTDSFGVMTLGAT